MAAFNARRALEFAASIARPRLCGTAEERAVAQVVKKSLADAGLGMSEEFFEFRPVADNLLRFSLLLTHLGLAAIGVGLWKDVRIAWGGLGFCAALAVILPWFIRRTFLATIRDCAEGDPPRRGWIRSSNIAGRADGPADGPLFVFMAHYDSKSQSLSLGGRIALFRWARTAAFGYLGAAMARMFDAAVPLELIAVAGGFVFLLSLPLYALRTHNRSPGAMDNASGVGALVEMARAWKDVPGSKNARAVFLAVSGEEFGMTGSQAWVRRHLDTLRREERLRVINFDGVGYAGAVWVVPAFGPEGGGVSMSSALIGAGKAVGVEVRTFPRSVGLMTDHASFTRERLPCATLLTHSWLARRLHTPADEMETLRIEGFERCGRVASRAVEELTR